MLNLEARPVPMLAQDEQGSFSFKCKIDLKRNSKTWNVNDTPEPVMALAELVGSICGLLDLLKDLPLGASFTIVASNTVTRSDGFVIVYGEKAAVAYKAIARRIQALMEKLSEKWQTSTYQFTLRYLQEVTFDQAGLCASRN